MVVSDTTSMLTAESVYLPEVFSNRLISQLTNEFTDEQLGSYQGIRWGQSVRDYTNLHGVVRAAREQGNGEINS
jgi:hypothetical protein